MAGADVCNRSRCFWREKVRHTVSLEEVFLKACKMGNDVLDSSSRAQPAMMRHGEALSTMAWTLEHAHWTSVREQPCSERALVRHSMKHLGSWSMSSVRESIARAEVTRVAKKRKRMVGNGF